MTFVEAKQEFDSKYEHVAEFACFIQEHLSFNKKTNFKNKNGTKNEQFINGSFYMPLFNLGFLQKTILEQKYIFLKGINLPRL